MDFQEFNDEVKLWGKTITVISRNKAEAMGVTHVERSPSNGASLQKLRDKYRTAAGTVNRISLTFPRALIYTMRGAGKGVGGSKGSRWITKKGENKKTNPASLGKIGTGNRRQKDFINQALNSPEGVEKLADIAALALADVVINNIHIK